MSSRSYKSELSIGGAHPEVPTEDTYKLELPVRATCRNYHQELPGRATCKSYEQELRARATGKSYH